jgi:hypothetical protein
MGLLPRLLANRRGTAGAGLVVGGVLVLGLWTLLGWIVPLLLLGIALVLVLRRSALGAAATVVGAGLLFWFGLTLGWIAWAVGLVLIAGGLVLLLGRGKLPADGRDA